MDAIITGDMVQSTRIDDKELMLAELQSILTTLANAGWIGPGFDVYRGDSFQLLVKSPADALKTALVLRAMLMLNTPADSPMDWEARLSIGLGDISYQAERLTQSAGSAFEYSGRELERMKNRERIRFTSADEGLNDEFETSLALAEFILSRWSRESAETAMAHFFYSENQREMAENRFHISQPAVSGRFRAAGLDALDLLTRRFSHRINTYLASHE